jgi:hypothetical protein
MAEAYTEPRRAIRVTVYQGGDAAVGYNDGRESLLSREAVDVRTPPVRPPLAERAWAWAQANPVKVYAIVALLGGVTGRVVPDWANQLLTILL